MTTPAVTVEPIIDTSPDISTALTFTLANIAAHDGTLTTEQWRYVQSVIDGLLTSLWSGQTSSRETWEATITMRRKDWRGLPASTPKPKEKKSESTTEKNEKELKLKGHLGNVDIFG